MYFNVKNNMKNYSILLMLFFLCFSLPTRAQDEIVIQSNSLIELMEQIDALNKQRGMADDYKKIEFYREKRRAIPSKTAKSIFDSDTIHILCDAFQGDETLVLGGHQEFVKGSHDAYYLNFLDPWFEYEKATCPMYYDNVNATLSDILQQKIYTGEYPETFYDPRFDNSLYYYELIKTDENVFVCYPHTYLVNVFTYELLPVGNDIYPWPIRTHTKKKWRLRDIINGFHLWVVDANRNLNRMLTEN